MQSRCADEVKEVLTLTVGSSLVVVVSSLFLEMVAQ